MPLQRRQLPPPPPAFNATSPLVKPCMACIIPVDETRVFVRLRHKQTLAHHETPKKETRAPRRGQPLSFHQNVSRNTATSSFWAATYDCATPAVNLALSLLRALNSASIPFGRETRTLVCRRCHRSEVQSRPGRRRCCHALLLVVSPHDAHVERPAKNVSGQNVALSGLGRKWDSTKRVMLFTTPVS